ncbi:hypothetical protein RRG08_002773 [Elysia crispata]|uniref:Uncharacterized protein n=1 Tax=Elysia crispata TaxID=231223 RepID=A0AAE0XU20_9GAST|nr:hypothetical protein RRG08_002773 [Elysia crispata]
MSELLSSLGSVLVIFYSINILTSMACPSLCPRILLIKRMRNLFTAKIETDTRFESPCARQLISPKTFETNLRDLKELSVGRILQPLACLWPVGNTAPIQRLQSRSMQPGFYAKPAGSNPTTCMDST